MFAGGELAKAVRLVENAKTCLIMDRSDLPERKEVKLDWLNLSDLLSEGGSGFGNFGGNDTGYLSYAILTLAIAGTLYYSYKRCRIA